MCSEPDERDPTTWRRYSGRGRCRTCGVPCDDDFCCVPCFLCRLERIETEGSRTRAGRWSELERVCARLLHAEDDQRLWVDPDPGAAYKREYRMTRPTGPMEVHE